MSLSTNANLELHANPLPPELSEPYHYDFPASMAPASHSAWDSLGKFLKGAAAPGYETLPDVARAEADAPTIHFGSEYGPRWFERVGR
jgi:hypothetical protein